MSRVIFSCLVLLVLPLPSMSLSVVMHNRDEFEIEGSAWENGLDGKQKIFKKLIKFNLNK